MPEEVGILTGINTLTHTATDVVVVLGLIFIKVITDELLQTLFSCNHNDEKGEEAECPLSFSVLRYVC